MHLKPIDRQVMVITGASSGIGLCTARMAARQGAKLVVSSRNEQVLRQLVDEIQSADGRAIYVVGDVGNEADVRRLAEGAVEHFGRIDTWVNNAGVSIYGRLEEVSIEDHRKLFETNFWGVVHGSLAAIDHLSGAGGAIVNIGSVLSDRAIPLQGMYCASKHAVKGFTDALRMELEEAGAPISVTLIKPSAIDTPYKEHAKNYLPVEPKNPPPVYAPQLVAEAILHAAQHPVRDLVVGGGGRAIAAMGRIAPRLTDLVMEKTMFDQQKTTRPARHDGIHRALWEPGDDGRERGDYEGTVLEHSFYTKATMHPVATGALVLGAGLALAALWQASSER